MVDAQGFAAAAAKKDDLVDGVTLKCTYAENNGNGNLHGGGFGGGRGRGGPLGDHYDMMLMGMLGMRGYSLF